MGAMKPDDQADNDEREHQARPERHIARRQERGLLGGIHRRDLHRRQGGVAAAEGLRRQVTSRTWGRRLAVSEGSQATRGAPRRSECRGARRGFTLRGLGGAASGLDQPLGWRHTPDGVRRYYGRTHQDKPAFNRFVGRGRPGRDRGDEDLARCASTIDRLGPRNQAGASPLRISAPSGVSCRKTVDPAGCGAIERPRPGRFPTPARWPPAPMPPDRN